MEMFFAVLASLFSVVNPFGAVPVFLAMTPTYSVQERRKAALHTSIYFILILGVFFFAGTSILSFFGISLHAMRIAGGLIILLSGYSLMGAKFAESRAISKKVKEEALEKQDISFSPMAMPMLAGPGSISLLIGLYAQYEPWNQKLLIAGVIIVTGALTYSILRSSRYLYKILGESGIRAMSRIMGFLVMAIGIQYIMVGIIEFINKLNA